ncbi:hypothetical protein [Brevifollis gellanilyticus]|uniref:Uncharacterized protein n=1 Tax=Brevifollis gellanilyticus TaxID=748831 RepID=A0A512MFW3_9BACT|nr:hypothetical protein [Brevifollis gellanilyticus]GEP45609.1 hypothetical protein BGE01nite_49000 [Brevifollis gellanilyticus]
MKTRARTSTKSQNLSADFGAQLHAIKEDLSKMMTLLQNKWGEIRRDTHPGETVSELVKKTGLDQTWNGIKEAAASTVQPWLGSSSPAPKRATKKRSTAARAKTAAKKAVKAARKTARKAVTRATTATKKRR